MGNTLSLKERLKNYKEDEKTNNKKSKSKAKHLLYSDLMHNTPKKGKKNSSFPDDNEFINEQEDDENVDEPQQNQQPQDNEGGGGEPQQNQQQEPAQAQGGENEQIADPLAGITDAGGGGGDDTMMMPDDTPATGGGGETSKEDEKYDDKEVDIESEKISRRVKDEVSDKMGYYFEKTEDMMDGLTDKYESFLDALNDKLNKISAKIESSGKERGANNEKTRQEDINAQLKRAGYPFSNERDELKPTNLDKSGNIRDEDVNANYLVDPENHELNMDYGQADQLRRSLYDY